MMPPETLAPGGLVGAQMRAPTARPLTIALVGNFPPRRCGIATFTADIAAALGQDVRTRIVAMSDGSEDEPYDARVRTIRWDSVDDYRAAAAALDGEGIDVLCLQHEYGIFGGPAGEHVLALLEAVHCPVVTTLHTILREPDEDQRRVLGAIVRRSSAVIVMSRFGAETLQAVHRVPADKIVIAPHGAPDRPFVDPDTVKPGLDLAGRQVLLTFGLLSPNKGIETVIESLPALVERFPDLLYVVLGATHPHLLRREGEAYLERLKALAEARGVARNVRFEHRYTTQEELLDSRSGRHLRDALSPRSAGDVGHAGLCGRARQAGGLDALLARPRVAAGWRRHVDAVQRFRRARRRTRHAARRQRRAKRDGAARLLGRPRDHVEQCRQGVSHCLRKRRPRKPAHATPPRANGVAQSRRDRAHDRRHRHLPARRGDRRHGYCLDDAARALILANRIRANGLRDTGARRIAHVCAALIHDAWNDDEAAFRNFMGFDRRWLESVGSPDSMGRAFWALGETVRAPSDPALAVWAAKLTARAMPAHTELKPLRARAFAVLGAGAPAHFAERPVAFRVACACGRPARCAARGAQAGLDLVRARPDL
jgi:hypothetical protein